MWPGREAEPTTLVFELLISNLVCMKGVLVSVYMSVEALFYSAHFVEKSTSHSYGFVFNFVRVSVCFSF